jgi:O-antigen ligase
MSDFINLRLREVFAMFKAKTNKKSFFLSEGYPLLTFALIVFGYFTKLELYTIILNTLLVCVAILQTKSIKPFLFYVLTFMYQMNPAHMPQKPYHSDYFYTGYPLYLMLGTAAILVVCVIIFVFRSHMLVGVNWHKLPLLIPLIIFSVSMLTNGLLYEGENLPDLLWGAGQVFVYLILYLLLYLGLRGEDGEELSKYFSYLTILMSWILILEVGELFVFGNAIEGGTIIRGRVVLGFGNCNIVGAHAAMLIPINFYGFIKGKYPYLSLVTAVFIYLVALASTSRNAMLFGSVYFVLFFAIALFYVLRGVDKKTILKMFGGFVVFAIAFVAIFWDQLNIIIQLYLNRGMGDSGRYSLWRQCFDHFLNNPIFGRGFYSLDIYTPNSFDSFSFDLVPDFAHNTVFELLGATGIVGFIGYSIYRISTLVLAFYRTSKERLLLVMGASLIVMASLLDNYIFQIFGPVYYTVAMVIAGKIYEREMEIWNKKDLPKVHIKPLKVNL